MRACFGNTSPEQALLNRRFLKQLWPKSAEMARDNRLWGAERIRGELLKLGIHVCKRTVQKYIRQVRTTRPHGQTWATFLRTHAEQMWACDFLPVTDLLYRSLYAFFIIELHSRKVIHVGITRSPTDAWVAQQLREATPYGQVPKYLIRDNDSKFGPCFARVARTSGIKSSVSAFSGVCVANVSITCSSSMRSSFTECSTRMRSTSTRLARIKGSGRRFRSLKLGQCQQIMQVARSSPSPSWVVYITTIAGALEFFHPYEEVGD